MSDATAIAGAVDAAEAAFGTVTILVNNAGMPDAQRAHKMSLELIDAVIDTNIRAVYVLSCEVARRLIAAEQARPHREHLVERVRSTTPAAAPRSTRCRRRR